MSFRHQHGPVGLAVHPVRFISQMPQHKQLQRGRLVRLCDFLLDRPRSLVVHYLSCGRNYTGHSGLNYTTHPTDRRYASELQRELSLLHLITLLWGAKG